MTQKRKRSSKYALNVKLLGKGDNNAGNATHLKIGMRPLMGNGEDPCRGTPI
jgi:hypothetical protein